MNIFSTEITYSSEPYKPELIINYEWEVIEDSKKYMTFSDALEFMKQGKILCLKMGDNILRYKLFVNKSTTNCSDKFQFHYMRPSFDDIWYYTNLSADEALSDKWFLE